MKINIDMRIPSNLFRGKTVDEATARKLMRALMHNRSFYGNDAARITQQTLACQAVECDLPVADRWYAAVHLCDILFTQLKGVI